MTEKEVKKYLKNHELDVQSAIASNLVMDLVFPLYVNSEPIKGAILAPVFGFNPLDDSMPFYEFVSKDVLFNMSRKIYLQYNQNPAKITSLINKRSSHHKQMDRLWRRYQKIGDLSDQELFSLYKKMVGLAKKFWALGMIGEDKYQIIDIEITPHFARRHNLDLSRAQGIITILSHPKKLGVFSVERKEFLNLCLLYTSPPQMRRGMRGGDEFDHKIRCYLKNYFWLKTDFYRAQEIKPESLLSEIKKEIKHKGRKGILEEIKKMEQNFSKIEKQKKEILATLKLTKKDMRDLEFVRSAVWWQDQRKAEMMKHFHYILRLVEEISNRLKINYKDAVACTLDEFEKLLDTNKNYSPIEPLSCGESQRVSTDRRPQKIFVVYQTNKKPVFFSGKTAEKLLAVGLKVKQTDQIKGMVASRGKNEIIKGVARIVQNPGRDEFKEGEILVTSMTRIEFVPLMRRAKAIITDEGGIACHAAIVSRELGIPCIIGTKIATKVLKDGDLVEVDANRGIARILKR